VTVRARFRRVDEVPFSSERKLMSSIEADRAREGRIAVVTKGAPDVLLARCTAERVEAGTEPLTEERRAEILAGVDRCLNSRSERSSAFRGLFSNRLLTTSTKAGSA
jgi:magnesium-transporting ATPase (P-type)